MIDAIFTGNRRSFCREHFFAGMDRFDMGTLRAFNQYFHGAVRQLQHLQDIGDAADAIHILFGRLILGRRFLGHQQDALASLHGGFQCLDRLGTTNEERDDHVRKHNDIAQRKQRQFQCFGGQIGGIRHLLCLMR